MQENETKQRKGKETKIIEKNNKEKIEKIEKIDHLPNKKLQEYSLGRRRSSVISSFQEQIFQSAFQSLDFSNFILFTQFSKNGKPKYIQKQPITNLSSNFRLDSSYISINDQIKDQINEKIHQFISKNKAVFETQFKIGNSDLIHLTFQLTIK
eukprot:Anaeramoba_ignava/c21028_g1_i1.p2 GENE.c21028_g1_i1~~c21028_g1_i1.p2  ORF type:complete len:153 (-),score=65.75 c21028_g1_i1:3135-3593(-)